MPTILDLLMALNRGDLPPVPSPAPSAPIPLAPVGNLGPLSSETTAAFAAQNPEPVPPRFIQPAAPDANFVNQYSGAAPTPPAPPSRAQRIMNAIAGFGAGVQGQGAQFLSQLQEPQREYQRQVERYEGRRTQGTELAERRAEREAAQANRANEMLYESEYKKWLSKNADRSDEAKERMRQMFTLQRDAAAARLDEEKAQRLERRQREDDARGIAGRLGTGPGAASPEIAKELGRYYANLTDKLSPAAAKWVNAQARRAEILARRAVSGGGTGGGADKLVEQFENLKRQLYPARERGDTAQENSVMRRIEAIGAKLQAKGYEVGYGDNPYVKPPGGTTAQPTAQPQGPTAQFPEFDPTKIFNLAPVPVSSAPTDDEVKAYAKRFKMSPKKARAELMGQ